MKSQHNWGYVFKRGVSYTASAEASFEGIGGSRSITFTAEESFSNGGFKEVDQIIEDSVTCIAKPMTEVVCTTFAHPIEITMKYTIYWKNSTPTRGVYTGSAWKSDFKKETKIL